MNATFRIGQSYRVKIGRYKGMRLLYKGANGNGVSATKFIFKERDIELKVPISIAHIFMETRLDVEVQRAG